MKMKSILTLAILCFINSLGQAQDTLVVFKKGAPLFAFPKSQVDTIQFKTGQPNDSILFYKSGNVFYREKVSLVDSITKKVPAGYISDIDNNLYPTVKIGNQTWLAKNLSVKNFNDGTPIPLVANNTEWNTLKTPGMCYYQNTPSYQEAYGMLYNWYVVDTKKLCPVGWHVPNQTEWSTLDSYLSSNKFSDDGQTFGSKIAKSLSSKTLWITSSTVSTPGYNMSTNNKSGFNGVPAGERNQSGNFSILNSNTSWWSSTVNSLDATEAFGRGLSAGTNYLINFQTTNTKGFSIRCLKN